MGAGIFALIGVLLVGIALALQFVGIVLRVFVARWIKIGTLHVSLVLDCSVIGDLSERVSRLGVSISRELSCP